MDNLNVKNDNPNPANGNEQGVPVTPVQIPSPEELVNDKIKKIEELNDKYVRLYAEFDNYKKRMSRERIETILFAGEGILKSILPVVDDLERAVKSAENSSDMPSLKEGIKLIYNKLNQVLATNGLQVMEMPVQEFNSDLHDAVTHIPAADATLKGKIVEVIEKGYFLNGRVIRHAKVVVGS